MPALSPLTTLPPFLLASALSAYALYLSKTNISLLQKYESASEKAAQWSNTAAQRLRKTRTTQASGTVAAALSFLAGTTLPFLPSYHSPATLGLLGLSQCLLLYGARTHMSGFWNEGTQARVPFLEGFNDAVRGSEAVVGVLDLLVWSWAVAGGVWLADLGALGVGVWAGVVGARGVWVMRERGGGGY
ncbi:hypothetical protein B5807_03505 [Epicoccum nigrum]|uniref:Uncharacterized protein n=1 Tax=Epicoccum nigrum TaxID=105696 RepID=A0A1Y2M7J0_EPING|nr:hypothetical protein B5807_03505 [Epicoccum nigrum]